MKSAHLPSLWTSLGEIRLLNDFVRGWLAEDELAAIGMVMGAGWASARALPLQLH